MQKLSLMHSLLQRQINKYFNGNLPEHPGFSGFIEAIETAYSDADKRNRSLENIVTISTAEAETKIENFQSVINEASLVAVLSKEGKVISLNKNLQKLTGLTDPQKFYNCDIHDLIGPGQTRITEQAVAKLKQGLSWQGEIQFPVSKGSSIWLSGTACTLRDESRKATGIIVILYDITSRKLFEDEVINSERKYKAVLNNIKDVVFQADKSGEWTYLNASWKDLTGYEIADTLGRKICDFIYSSDITKLNDHLNDTLNQTALHQSFVASINDKTGEIKKVEISIRPTLSQTGSVIGVSGTINDITEKDLNLNLLSASSSFQKAILDSARQGIISTDLMGIIKTCNRGACQLVGIQAESELINKHIFENIISNDSSNLDKIFSSGNRVRKEELKEEIECKIKTLNNQKIDALLSLSEIKDQNENTTGYLFIISDNSKRKRAEEEIYKLNTIIEESPDYVSYYDMSGHLLYANKAYKELRNLENIQTEPELYPKWAELVINRKAIPHAILHGSWKGETAIYDSQKKEIPVLQLIIIHKDESGNPIFRSSISRDITHRKIYEHKLLQSEKRNRDLVNYSQAIICTHNMQGELLSINPSGTNLLEYSMEELIGINISSLMPAEFRPLFIDQYLNSFHTGKVAEGILYLVSKSGKSISLLYKNYKVDEPGEESYVIGFAQDVTERLIAEAELKTAKLIAEESARAKELFLANMSHEIRTPMNGIVGLTNLLIKTSLNDKQKEYAGSVKQNAENLLVVINDILDFSKIQAGKLEIVKEPFEIGSLLYNIRQTFKAEAQRKQLELVTILDDKLPKFVKGDSIRINQVLVNLISNAIKFTETGEVTLTSKLITKRNEACRVQFNVSDSGIGIQNDKLDKIFNSFTQANADTSRKYGGTGLGLTIVKNLLDLMGSSIKVKSQPGHGSTFQFELNLETCTSDDFSQVEYEESNNEGKLSGYRILLAEDNKVNQLFASELISEWGAVLDIADNGKIAVEYVAKNQYDLVLMDIQMPEMSGLEATTVIRNEFTKPANEIIIIAMTANAMKGDENQFRKAGMNDVIFKPYHANELYLMLCKHLKVNEEISVNKSVSPLEMPGVEEVKEPILKHINLHTLKSFSRGKNAFIVKMLNALVESVPPTFNELDKAIQSKDWISVNRFSHKLIPNMNMIGNPFLETEIKWMEDNAVDQKSQIAILSKWSTIKQEMQKSIEELRLVDSFYQSIETKNKN